MTARFHHRHIGALLCAALIAVAGSGAGPARADCGDPGEPACTGPVPTAEQVQADLLRITDPTVPWQQRSEAVDPGFTPEEGERLDKHLNWFSAHGYLPFAFDVTDIQPAPDDYAGVTVSAPHPWTPPGPMALVKRGEQWKITHETAMKALDALWYNATDSGSGSSYNGMQPGTSGMTH